MSIRTKVVIPTMTNKAVLLTQTTQLVLVGKIFNGCEYIKIIQLSTSCYLTGDIAEVMGSTPIPTRI